MQVLRVDFKAENADVQFAQSLKNTGFAVLTNHNIPINTIKAVYSQWQDYFNSDNKYEFPFDSVLQDGFFPVGAETAKGSDLSDIKEFYQIYPKGRIPQQLREITMELRAHKYQLAKTLLSWLQQVTPDVITQRFDRPLTEMISNDRTMYRIIHYPAFDGSETPGAVRAQEHGDINLLTVLPAASEGGLQVKDTQGRWHEVPCDFGSIAINTGDMLQMLTQGYYPSTLHQVINPVGEKEAVPRIATPLFLHPKADVLLKPGLNAESYLDQRLKEIGIREA